MHRNGKFFSSIFNLQGEKSVTVKDLDTGKADRTFTFDHAMWSHDGFETEESGYHKPARGSNYCDQAKAWNMLGEGMLNKAWKGLNVTMFAYG